MRRRLRRLRERLILERPPANGETAEHAAVGEQGEQGERGEQGARGERGPRGLPDRRKDQGARKRMNELAQWWERSAKKMWLAIAGLWLVTAIFGGFIYDGQRDSGQLIRAVQESRYEATRDGCERTNSQNRSIREVLAFSRASIDDDVDRGEISEQEAARARQHLDEAIAKFPLTEDCEGYARVRIEAGGSGS